MHSSETITIRNAEPQEHLLVGELLVSVYSSIDGFPNPSELPAYYELLRNVGQFSSLPGTEIVVAADHQQILGAVVFFSEMKNYGSGGIAPQLPNAAAFRLLAVSKSARGLGIGKLLTMECIHRAQNLHCQEMIIHSTEAMKTARKMYADIGFLRSEDLDFLQGNVPVLGFRLPLPATTSV